MPRTLAAARLAALLLLGTVPPLAAEEVGRIGTDWTGNDVVIDAVPDPEIEGITCHLTYFSRSLIDRVWQGNVFEDPSNTSIACRQTGPIKVGDIDLGDGGEDIFSQRQSLIFKSIAVRRVYDKKNQTMIYVSYSRQIKESSAKMSISTVPLHGVGVQWASGKAPD